MVVSLIPNFNACLVESVRRALPESAFVTVLTDLADYPPHFWMERQSEHIICGSDRAVAQARALGHGGDTIHRVSGMILNPRFYQPVKAARAPMRHQLGLDPDVPTALVLFGGYGSREMVTVADHLQDSAVPLQAIFICGRNTRLANQLKERKLAYRFAVEGFTNEVPAYMSISDFLIGKPGPGCISEAVQMGLPIIVNCNRWTLPQERFNATWVRENGVGLVVRNFTAVGLAAQQLIAHLDQFRWRAAQLENRAVFEVVECLEKILRASDAKVSPEEHLAISNKP